MAHCKVCYRKENSRGEDSLLTKLLEKRNEKMTLVRWNASDNYCIEDYFTVEIDGDNGAAEVVITQGDTGRTCVHFI